MNTPTIFNAEFNGLAIDIIDHAGKRWLTAEQVGLALGYNEANAGQGVRNLYNRHKDEFTEADTCQLNLIWQGQQREVRVFSSTGCVSLSWLSGTARAKEFKQWAKQNLAAQMDGEKVALSFDEFNTIVDCAKSGEVGREARQRAQEISNRFRRGQEIVPVPPVDTDARLDRLTGAMEQMALHMDEMAVGIDIVLSQINVTGRYIGLLEQNQRGTVRVTPEICAQAQEMLAAGTPQVDIARLLRISRGTVWRIKSGEFINKEVSGPLPSDSGVVGALQNMADACRAAAVIQK